MSMMWLLAKVAKIRMVASDEWTIHVKSAENAIAIDGSLSSGAIISGSVSDVFRGSVASRINVSDSSMRPTPIKMRYM